MKNMMRMIVGLPLLALVTTQTGFAISREKANTIMATAASLIGAPYEWGAKGPNKFDCSGLTKWCFKKGSISIPDGSADQFKHCNTSVRTDTKAALLFFATDPAKPGKVNHVTLNCGDGTNSIGANGPGGVNKVEKFKITSSYWKRTLVTCAVRSSW